CGCWCCCCCRRGWRGCCRGRCGCRAVFGGDQQEAAGLGIERDGLGADWRLDGLLDDKVGGRVFLDDGEGAVALGAKGFHGGGVEGGAVAAGTDGQGGEDLAGGSVDDDHDLRRTAGGEENAVFDVEGQAGATVATGLDVNGVVEFHGVGVDV